MALQGTSNHSVWPSAFQWIEKPLYDQNEERNNGALNTDSNFYKMLAKQYVYWPLVMCATPVTCLADMVAGFAESAFSVYQGEGLSRVPSILHKKIIASPLQHLIFFGSNMVVPVMFGFAINDPFKMIQYVNRNMEVVRSEWKFDFSGYKASFLISTVLFGPIAGLFSYHMAQQAVGRLSDWAHPEGFNIFINGGCVDPNGRKMTDSDFAEKAYKDYVRQRLSEAVDDLIRRDPESLERHNKYCREQGLPEYTHNSNVPKVSIDSWPIFIAPLQSQIPELDDSLGEFEKFSKAVKEGKSPQQCLGIPNKPNVAEIKKAYLKLSLAVHPDRNKERVEIATILFKALNEARLLLENQLKK